MDRVRVGPVKGLWIATTAFVLSVVLALGGVGATIYLLNTRSGDVEDFSTQLRAGLVKSCEENGNPLREAVRGQIRDQIRQRQRLDYARFFPNVPVGVLQRLLDEQTRADFATLKRIAPVNCSALYPRP